MNRRLFFQIAAAVPLTQASALQASETGANVFGPTPGYSPQIGILVSEMNWMREAVLMATRGMTQEQLDFLLDNKANRIGALILHLAATEKLYQLNTFDNISVNELYKSPAFKEWVLPTNNLCKWFHVCEHESHHTGQMSLLRSRVPGANA